MTTKPEHTSGNWIFCRSWNPRQLQRRSTSPSLITHSTAPCWRGRQQGRNQLNTAGQLWLELPGFAEDLETASTRGPWQAIEPVADFRVFHSPVAGDGVLQVFSSVPESAVFRLFDANGKQVRVLRFMGAGSLPISGLPAGLYARRVENGKEMRVGRVVVEGR